MPIVFNPSCPLNPSLYLPSATHPPIHLSSISIKKTAGLPWISRKHALWSCSKTKHLPCIKAAQGNPVWGIRSQKLDKESESAPIPTVSSPTRSQTYTTVTYLWVVVTKQFFHMQNTRGLSKRKAVNFLQLQLDIRFFHNYFRWQEVERDSEDCIPGTGKGLASKR